LAKKGLLQQPFGVYLAGVELHDDYQHKGQRKKLLDELRKMGIQAEAVLEAMSRVPRHFFLSSAFDRFAYQNQAFQIGAGQTISKPFTVARQTELLGLGPGAKVLEIGTGSGYQCAVLCAMGYKVHSIERQKELFDKAGPLLKAMGWKPELYYGDGYKGKPVFAPFDGIIVTCGAPEVPEALLGQLAIGGTLVIPVGDGDGQRMFTLKRVAETEFTQAEHGEFAFVPMLASRAPKALR
jgi:protein-L-isoaspartate(D-aspartate) O-methyltransferase